MKIRISGALVHAIAQGLTDTLTFHRFGLGNLRRARACSPRGGLVGVLWHQNLFSVIAPHHHMRIAALASLSGDGALIAEHLSRSGIRVVRGSSSRGAARAAKELYQALADGWLLAITCDGPKGPERVVKEGPIEIARRAGVPLVPVAARATREIAFKRSWDGFRLPLPRAHLAVVYGEPIIFPPHEPSADELAARCLLVGRRLDALEAEAARRCGRGDGWSVRSPDRG